MFGVISMRKRTCNRNRAFTLVEMLVNLAIISLLAAILFPVFSRVRDNARRSSCQSNLKQLGLSFMLYAQDNDEKFPCGNETQPSPYLGMGWAAQVKSYVGNPQIYRCPSDPARLAAPMLTASYAYNNNLVHKPDDDVFTLVPLSAFVEPSRTVLCSEVRWGRFDPSDPDDWRAPITNGVTLFGGGRGNASNSLQLATGLFSNSPADSHLCNNRDPLGVPFESAHLNSSRFGGANYLAVDGHVKWFETDSVSAGVGAKAPGMPQRTNYAESVTYAGPDKHAITYSHS
jgi:prepilin-type N-terminal cleavage/methylation domain-containing protein/prepilin-type processing-associated H-X9-DG protein